MSPAAVARRHEAPAVLRVAVIAVIAWMVLIAVLGAAMGLRAIGVPALGDAERTFWSDEMIVAAIVVYAACLLPTLAAARLKPAAVVPIALTSAGAIVLLASSPSDAWAALLSVTLITVLTWLAGEAALGLAHPQFGPTILRVPVAFALGNVALGLVLLIVGSAGFLTAPALALVAVVGVIASIAIIRRRDDAARTRISWPRPTVLEAAIIGSAAGIVAFALLTALIPESAADAVRHHLITTREFWRDGVVGVTPSPVSELPVHAQLVSVPAWAIGGQSGVKLSHAVVGLMAIAATAGLAGRLAGRTAAVAATALLVSLPLVLWELGHAYVDLYPALFVVAAAAAIAVWQRSSAIALLVVAGALAGTAIAAKLVAVTAVAGLGIALLLVGRGRLSSGRLVAVGAFVIGGLAYLPWLVRSVAIDGTIPGLDLLLVAIAGEGEGIGDLARYGFGRSPVDLLRLPWDATFRGEVFVQNGVGAMGIIVLMALPLVVFVPRTRTSAFLIVAAIVALIGWALTAQYLRYVLPLVAIVTVLVAAGLSVLVRRLRSSGPAWAPAIPVLLLAFGLWVTPLLSLPNWQSQLPVGIFVGQLDRDAAAAEIVADHGVLRATSSIGGPDDLVWWFDASPARIFGEPRIERVDVEDVGTTPAAVLATMDEAGVRYFGWSRSRADPEDELGVILGTPFLLGHTHVVDTSDGAYLFGVHEERADRWGVDGPSLVPELPRSDAAPEAGDGWLARNGAGFDATGASLRGGSIRHVVKAEAGAAYTLLVDAACATDEQAITLVYRWRDTDRGVIRIDFERVRPGREGDQQFLWKVAPEGASQLTVDVGTFRDADCHVTDVSLHRAGPAT